MRMAGRVAAAIEVLTDVFTQHRPASEALKDWGKAHRFAGSTDRHAIGTLVYDVLRVFAGQWKCRRIVIEGCVDFNARCDGVTGRRICSLRNFQNNEGR